MIRLASARPRELDALSDPPRAGAPGFRAGAGTAARLGWTTLLLLAAGCGPRGAAVPAAPNPVRQAPRPAGPAWFVECAASAGLAFEHRSGHDRRFLFPETACGGAALFDMDGDGDLDAYLVQSGGVAVPPDQRPGNQLFENDGRGNFRNVTAGSGADDRGYGMGVTTGDYDNDGDVDLYVTNLGRNTLLRNEGGGVFSDQTEASNAGLADWSSSAAFLDFDADGDLDLFVVNYVHWSLENEQDCRNNRGELTYCGPNIYSPARDCLLENNGDGSFTDITEQAGLGAAIGNGLGVVCGDFDGDGLIDIYVANDMSPNQLWLNQGEGRFSNQATLWGCALDESGRPKAGMGVTAEDLDDDLDLDLLVVNLHGETDSVFRNDGSYFTDTSGHAGLAIFSMPYTRFGMGLVDFDNDGRLDLYIANGRINSDLPSVAADPLAEPNLLYQGLPGSKFRHVEPRGGTSDPLVLASRGAAFGDVDGDGGVDILVVNKDGPASLLRNAVKDRANWIRFRVLDRHGRDALGATLTIDAGGRRMRREYRTAYGYQSAHDPIVHVGLGEAVGVERVEVRWPTGETRSFGAQRGGTTVELRP